MGQHNVGHLSQDFLDAVRLIAIRGDTLRAALPPIINHILRWSVDGFPPMIQPAWAWVHKVCLAEDAEDGGRVRASINAMGTADLEKLVGVLIDIAAWIENVLPDDHAGDRFEKWFPGGQLPR